MGRITARAGPDYRRKTTAAKRLLKLNMLRRGTKGYLFLNGKLVGTVAVRGANTSWYYGEFDPAPGFSDFAGTFGWWSLLMHSHGEDDLPSPRALDQLRHIETAIDALNAKLFFPDQQEWHPVAQLNLDRGMIEWKEF
jgi:hypothetical protein